MKLRWPRCGQFLSLCGGGESGELNISKRYRCLRRSLLFIMLLLTMAPLSLVAGLSFYRYQKLTQFEAENNIRWHAESACRSLEVFLDRLKDSLVVVAGTHVLPGLVAPERLDRLFADLKNKHPGLVDLSIIAPDGVQVAYAGPYNLRGKNYLETPWYNRALTRKAFVSEVFFGFRNVPHFVVAVTKKEADGYWLLRASIDTDTLDQFLFSISTELAEDIFLIDQEGQLQTSSRHYGRVHDTFPLAAGRRGKKEVSVIEKRYEGKELLQAVGTVQGTPWLLVLEQKNVADRSAWLSFRNQLLLIFVVTVVAAILIVVRISQVIAGRVREADETREKMLAETEHTNKLASVGRLAAGVAHEINNPLAIINEKAGLMKDLLQLGTEFSGREKFLQQLSGLEDAVKRARVITHRLLGFARRMESTMEKVQINEVLGEVMGFLDKEAMYRDIRIRLDLQPDLPVVESDRGQMQQIFLNIINNAIDAIGKNGNIDITTRQVSPRAVLVEISDDGPGIPEELIQNIFEPFFTTKRDSEKPGTGLGLAITYGLVKKLGGEVSVASGVGEGTTFSISFPLKG
ncbi:MAG: sensor histidine kinase [Thermodesulfobacteriota bacterium]